MLPYFAARLCTRVTLESPDQTELDAAAELLLRGGRSKGERNSLLPNPSRDKRMHRAQPSQGRAPSYLVDQQGRPGEAMGKHQKAEFRVSVPDKLKTETTVTET